MSDVTGLSDSPPTGRPLLDARGLTKAYGHVQALGGVDISINEAEVVALVGDNGAGKSTLIKCLCGAIRPDEGTIEVNGAEVSFAGPAEARRAGLSVVYQDLALVDVRDVAHNVHLGRLPVRFRFIVDRRRMERDAKEAIADLTINRPAVRTPVSQLSGGQRQAVAIARAVHDGGRLMILDEPTAALGVREGRHVLQVLDQLRTTRRLALLIVSHNLEHVFSIADRIIVLRGGRKVGERQRERSNPAEIVELITGAEVVASTDAGLAH
jgi:ABC-type sugar transport system ATPase subunit